VVGKEASHLGEGEDEDQVEEQFERSDALLGDIPALRHRTRRARRAHLMPSRLCADVHILASAASLLYRPSVQVAALNPHLSYRELLFLSRLQEF
jgi:hypothetical protein